ncbi:ElyC/SanA/YdcF family protein [Kineococcus sp. TBRC 1896]|uniref:ElyC/SanA/YdcF family protein n=1 Tax=Kineococcus mangrovi TaxID=1660183 RepID=A0ABV4I2F1_9ACTN
MRTPPEPRPEATARVLGAVLGAVVLVGISVEAVHALAAGRGFSGGRRALAPDVVVVLGCPPRPDGTVSGMQRWRTEIAARTPGEPVLVFSGYARPGSPSEAAVMAAHARDVLGVDPARLRTEETATTTWENVTRTLHDLEGARYVALASSPVHALRARRYLARLRPDLAARLVPAADYRFGERWGWKVMTAGYDLARSVGLRLPQTSDVFEASAVRTRFSWSTEGVDIR